MRKSTRVGDTAHAQRDTDGAPSSLTSRTFVVIMLYPIIAPKRIKGRLERAYNMFIVNTGREGACMQETETQG
jgi:hypothetical protein